MKNIVLASIIIFGVCVLFADVKSYTYEEHFKEISDPIPTNVTINPLDYVSGKIGQDIRNFPLPLGFRGQYRFGARYHLIDRISNQPLFMKTWGEENQLHFSNNQDKLQLESSIHALQLLRDTDLFENFESYNPERLLMRY